MWLIYPPPTWYKSLSIPEFIYFIYLVFNFYGVLHSLLTKNALLTIQSFGISFIQGEKCFRKLTLHPYAHQKFSKININLAPVNNSKPKNLLRSETKDKITPTQKSGIYKISCKGCNKSYIDKIKRNLNNQKEHFKNIRFKHLDKSAIAHHVWIENCDMDSEAKLQY